jgi:regulator of protease activity HflC (stomatin/prohibitin superfamily)
LLTCIVVVNPGEVAVIERWGRPRGIEKLPSAPSIDMTEQEKIALENEWDKLSSPLTPGIHIKYPWPIEITKKVMLEEVKEITIGAPQENIGKSEGVGVMKDVVSWDKVHTKDEFKYIMPLSSIEPKGTKNTIKSRQESMHNLDFMFISGVVSIHYTIGRYAEENIPGKIKPGDVYRYLYRYKDPLNLMITMAEQEVTRYWAGADFWDVLVKDRTRVENNLRDDIQKAADKSGIGVRVILVSLSNMHPPAGEIGKAYQEVVGAKEEREAKILEAKAKAAAVTASIEGQKAKILNDAKGYYNERTLVSKASSQRFKSQMKAYSAAPEVYIHREKMTAIEEGLSSSRKVLVAPPTVTTVIDDKQDFTAAGVGEALIREAANQ